MRFDTLERAVRWRDYSKETNLDHVTVVSSRREGRISFGRASRGSIARIKNNTLKHFWKRVANLSRENGTYKYKVKTNRFFDAATNQRSKRSKDR